MFFIKALPEFYEEVFSLLNRLGRNDLSGQLRNLKIVQRCPCTDFGCASFQVQGSSTPDSFETVSGPRPALSSTVDLDAEKGRIRVGVDQLGRIKSFEILNRPDVRRQLFKR